MGELPLRDVPSRIPDFPARASERVDPFWGGLWEKSTTVEWSNRVAAEAQARAGVATPPAPFMVDNTDPDDLLQRGWETKLRVLSALDSFRTVTTEQLAALTGNPKLLKKQSVMLPQLFAHKLVDVGSPSSAFSSAASAVKFWRLSSAGRRLRTSWLDDQLSYAQWARVTGGRDWIHGGQNSRHDALALELLLRSAEWNTKISAIAGEKYCEADEVLFTSWGKPWPLAKVTRAKADGLLVRKDGLRILIELTASTKGLEAKVERWAKAMAEGTAETQGAVVVFVLASRPETRSGGDSFGRVAGVINRCVRRFPGSPSSPTRGRIVIADWTRWFPYPDVVDEEFLALTAWKATGSKEAQTYESCEPINLSSAAFDTPVGALDARHTLAGLYASPFWMQDRYRGVGIQERRTELLFDRDSPVMHRQRQSGAVPGAKMPVRLRG